MEITNYIRTFNDFPEPGILFYDISPLLADPEAFSHTIDCLFSIIKKDPPDLVIGIESRGFLLAAPLSIKLKCGLVMARKSGKLPGPTMSNTYDLEYGTDTIEIQKDTISPGKKIVVIDDLLATGGTAKATIKLLKNIGADVVGSFFIIELNGLGGRDEIDIPITSLVSFDV
jgi:adenine phosphoribosyltransferase